MNDGTSNGPRDVFLADVVDGFGNQQRSIPGKYLWDEEGSKIFHEITQTRDYYQTAAEEALTIAALPEISSIIGAGACLVEFGSGASRKVRLLLDALDMPWRYVALDISREFLEASSRRVAADYPWLEVLSICADYSQPLPSLPLDRARPILGFLPGTSIGNMMPAKARDLLSELRRTLVSGFLLIGQDPNRDPHRLSRAYEGPLMTALHKNLLKRMVRELGARLDVDAFEHHSRTFADRVEPHLVAVEDTRIEIGARSFALARGESIRTDVSWKYSVEDFSALVASAGWSITRRWPDRDLRFCLYLLDARG